MILGYTCKLNCANEHKHKHKFKPSHEVEMYVAMPNTERTKANLFFLGEEWGTNQVPSKLKHTLPQLYLRDRHANEARPVEAGVSATRFHPRAKEPL
jgi:hypothetical protein